MNNTNKKILDEISIRTELQPGDLSYIIYQQAKFYHEKYQFGVDFEKYMLSGMYEFLENHNSEKDRVWICEHNNKIIGFLLLMHRENNSCQLRYFYINKEYRGTGLGKKLMQLYINFFKEKNYHSSYLWTTDELDSAISLYIKNGFKLTEEKPSNTFGKKVNEQLYVLSKE